MHLKSVEPVAGVLLMLLFLADSSSRFIATRIRRDAEGNRGGIYATATRSADCKGSSIELLRWA